MKTPLIFTDLDDTLFQTNRKKPAVMGYAHAMSTLADGTPSGFASKRQQRFLEWLRYGSLIPVTARSREVLARVNIDQAPAICSNGGCILGEDGAVDQDWHEHLADQTRGSEVVRDVYALVTSRVGTGALRHWVVGEDDLDLYFVIKANGNERSALDAATAMALSLVPTGWRIHRNGNNLAVLPPWLNKRNAVAHLIDRLRACDAHIPVVGIGDSDSDVGFMDLCDFAIIPTNSQIWGQLRDRNEWCC